MRTRRRDPELERFWRKATREQAKSGQSVRQYCEAHGLSAANWYAWRREIAKRDDNVASASSATFVPVRVMNSASIEVVMTTGVIIRVPTLADPVAVARLVEALEASPCSRSD